MLSPRINYKRKDYFFCGICCQKLFKNNPEKFLRGDKGCF